MALAHTFLRLTIPWLGMVGYVTRPFPLLSILYGFSLPPKSAAPTPRLYPQRVGRRRINALPLSLRHPGDGECLAIALVMEYGV